MWENNETLLNLQNKIQLVDDQQICAPLTQPIRKLDTEHLYN